ncbi:protease modulator HflC [Lentisphaerota bacterium WC36G]|nr:protease modulator HflC [Lentisphaerae bacterium WC36]
MSDSNTNTAVETNESNKLLRHWPSLILGLVVILIFAMILFTKQVRSTDYVIITTFGKVSTIYGYDKETKQIKDDGGLKIKLPFIQKATSIDKRIRPFIATEGSLEETITKDEKNIIIGIAMSYQIVDPEKFCLSYNFDVKEGVKAINSRMRSVRGEVINQYNFSDLINIDPKKMKTAEICEKIETSLNKYFKDYGIKISSVGLSTVNIPENTTKEVFERMKADRKRVAAESINRGKNESQRIKDDADTYKKIIIAKARSKAEQIRAEGDAEAAQYYKIFSKDPNLAAFLRKLEAMRNVTKSKTTLILDTESAPFDILKFKAINEKKQENNSK